MSSTPSAIFSQHCCGDNHSPSWEQAHLQGELTADLLRLFAVQADDHLGCFSWSNNTLCGAQGHRSRQLPGKLPGSRQQALVGNCDGLAGLRSNKLPLEADALSSDLQGINQNGLGNI